MSEEQRNRERWLILQAKIFEEKIKLAFELLRSEAIEPILIKGWAAARSYPQSFERSFSDIDLCVEVSKYEKAQKALSGAQGKSLNVDLHRGLRHLDTVEWEDLFANSETHWLEATGIRILRPEDHLRVLSVHWLNDGGVRKDRLLDIFYAVKNRRQDFSWERCLGIVDERRRRWVILTIGLAHKYFQLDTNDLPFAQDLKPIPEWIVQTIETEWSSKTPLRPLHTVTGDKKSFWRQIKKRMPPNPIQSTIEMEGSFGSKPRLYYQFGSIVLRLKPFVLRFYRIKRDSLRGKRKYGNVS